MNRMNRLGLFFLACAVKSSSSLLQCFPAPSFVKIQYKSIVNTQQTHGRCTREKASSSLVRRNLFGIGKRKKDEEFKSEDEEHSQQIALDSNEASTSTSWSLEGADASPNGSSTQNNVVGPESPAFASSNTEKGSTVSLPANGVSTSTSTASSSVEATAAMMEHFKRSQQVGKRTAALTEELSSTTLTGVAPGGKVKVFISGRQQPKGIEIDDAYLETVRPDDLVADITAAMQDAHAKSIDVMMKKMQGLYTDLGMPPQAQGWTSGGGSGSSGNVASSSSSSIPSQRS